MVGGMLLSGMSTIVVTPPAAAARVARGEALPLGAAGLVDVHVGVDQPGQQHLVVGEVDRRRGAVEVRLDRLDRDDRAVLHADDAAHLARRADHAGSTDHQVEFGHARASCSSRANSGCRKPRAEIRYRPAPNV